MYVQLYGGSWQVGVLPGLCHVPRATRTPHGGTAGSSKFSFRVRGFAALAPRPLGSRSGLGALAVSRASRRLESRRPSWLAGSDSVGAAAGRHSHWSLLLLSAVWLGLWGDFSLFTRRAPRHRPSPETHATPTSPQPCPTPGVRARGRGFDHRHSPAGQLCLAVSHRTARGLSQRETGMIPDTRGLCGLTRQPGARATHARTARRHTLRSYTQCTRSTRTRRAKETPPPFALATAACAEH